MTKQSGLGARLLIGGHNVSGDITAVGNIGGGPAALDCTGIDKEAFERVGGIFDGRCESTSWFNPTGAHPVFAALPTTDAIITYCHRATLGAPAASLIGKQPDYAGTRGNDGAFTFEQAAQLSGGIPLEWGELLTPGLREDEEATDGDQLDGGAASSFGLAAYLHVTALTGDDITVTIEGSADGNTWAAVTGGTFAEVTAAPAVERIQTAADATIPRYLRAVSAGTFTAASFAVAVVRHEVERQY